VGGVALADDIVPYEDIGNDGLFWSLSDDGTLTIFVGDIAMDDVLPMPGYANSTPPWKA